jgi:hypothetical protein
MPQCRRRISSRICSTYCFEIAALRSTHLTSDEDPADETTPAPVRNPCIDPVALAGVMVLLGGSGRVPVAGQAVGCKATLHWTHCGWFVSVILLILSSLQIKKI